MSEYKPTSFLRERLLSYFAGQTGVRAKSMELARQTLLHLHGANASCATDADVLPWALEIARNLLVEERRRARKEIAPRASDESAEAMEYRLRSSTVEDDLARLAVRRLQDNEGETLALAMRRYAGGDDTALEIVDEILAPVLLFYFSHQTCDRVIAVELVQGTLVQLHATPMNCATESDILCRLFAIARDALADGRRRMDVGRLSRTTDQTAEATDRRVDGPVHWDSAEPLERMPLARQPAGAALCANNPVWRKLYEALEKLAWLSGGAFAFVIDGGNALWCVARADSEPSFWIPGGSLRAAERFYEKELVPRLAEMRRGKPVYVANVGGADRYVAASFAGIYAVVVWFHKEFDPANVRAKIQRMLPEIQAHTLALPPWDGPGCDAGAVRARA
jgi:DNA-directed RNA polymerase specialized sigma24 family protein